MVEKEITVSNELGIHARPASMIVRTAMQFKSEIWLEKDGAKADAKSIMSVMMLAAGKGSLVLVRARGQDEDSAIETITHLFETRFNEE